MPCSIGRSGVVDDKREGDGGTPAGAFDLEFGLWRPDRRRAPRGMLPSRAIRSADGWSDDPADPAYNLPVKRPHSHRHERLWRADGCYDLIVPFTANRPPAVSPGRGSALFLHVWRRPRHPTEGCVAFRAADLDWILTRWTRRSRLIISR
ncbi:MAG: L,D-transpeptidase family protein [Pseudomonadota bacterium]